MEGHFLFKVTDSSLLITRIWFYRKLSFQWYIICPVPCLIPISPLAQGLESKSRFYNYKLSFKHKRCSSKTTPLSYLGHLKSVSSETPNLKLKVVCFEMCTNILEYLKEMPLVPIWKLEVVTYQNQIILIEVFCR